MDARRPVLRLPKSTPSGGFSNLSAGLNFEEGDGKCGLGEHREESQARER